MTKAGEGEVGRAVPEAEEEREDDEAEDEEVVENVQKGVRSRFYKQGRYAVNREQGTHHFHRLIAKSMNS